MIRYAGFVRKFEWFGECKYRCIWQQSVSSEYSYSKASFLKHKSPVPGALSFAPIPKGELGNTIPIKKNNCSSGIIKADSFIIAFYSGIHKPPLETGALSILSQKGKTY